MDTEHNAKTPLARKGDGGASQEIFSTSEEHDIAGFPQPSHRVVQQQLVVWTGCASTVGILWTAAALSTLNALGEYASAELDLGFDALQAADPFTSEAGWDEPFVDYGALYAAQAYWQYIRRYLSEGGAHIQGF